MDCLADQMDQRYMKRIVPIVICVNMIVDSGYMEIEPICHICIFLIPIIIMRNIRGMKVHPF